MSTIKFGRAGYSVNPPSKTLAAILAARESGNDVVAISIVTQTQSITGSLTAQETGLDQFQALGSGGIFGTMAAQETGLDQFQALGSGGIFGTMAAQEAGADTFSGAGGIQPTLDSFSYTDSTDGTANTVSVEYTGNVGDYDLQIESLNASNVVIETTTVAIGTDVDVTGFTTSSSSPSASPAGTATQLRATLVGGAAGDSNSITVAAAGLDFGVNGITWATNVAGTELIATSGGSDVLYAESTNLTDIVLSGTGGTATIGAPTGSGTGTLTYGLSGDIPLNGETLTLAYTNTGHDLRDQDGNEVANFSGVSVTNNVPSAATFAVTETSIQTSSTLDSSISFDLDASSFGSGDKIIFAYGPNAVVTSATYAGNAMTNVANATIDGGSGGRKLTVFEYELTGAGTASDTVVLTLDGSNNNHLFTAIFVEGGLIQESATDSARGATMTASVTPTDASNFIWAVATGEDGTGGYTSFTNVTEQEDVSGGANGRYMARGSATDSALSATSVSVTPVNATGGSSQDGAFAVILVEPS